MALYRISSTTGARERALGAFLGLATGDALGTTLEFTARDTKPPVTDMVGGGVFKLEPGEWTDDTSLALCLAQSLIACGGRLDSVDLMQRFSCWYRKGENSVTGHCFNIGNTTRAAIEAFERSRCMASDHGTDHSQAGNGSLMRLAPVAILAWPDADRAAALAEAQSRTTHAAPVANQACFLFAMLLVEAMSGLSKDEVLRSRVVDGALAPIAAGNWRDKDRAAISSSGYVVATLEASLWCVDRTESFAEAVLLAANLGDDADTVAAVTGQLAGALYGRSGIPSPWLTKLAWRDRIEALTDQLLTVGCAHEPSSATGGEACPEQRQVGPCEPQPRRVPSPRRRRTVWIDKVCAGNFEAIPQSFRWEISLEFAHLINGYEVHGFDDLAELSRRVLVQIEAGQGSELPALDLWLALFFRHRAYRHNGGEPEGAELHLLNQLCQALHVRLFREDATGRRLIADVIHASGS